MDEKLNLILQRSREHLIDFSIATNPNYVPAWHLDIIAAELEKLEREGDRSIRYFLFLRRLVMENLNFALFLFPFGIWGGILPKRLLRLVILRNLLRTSGRKLVTL